MQKNSEMCQGGGDLHTHKEVVIYTQGGGDLRTDILTPWAPVGAKKQERVLRITTQDNQNGEMNLFNVQQAAGGPLNPVYHPNQPIGSTVAQIYADLC